MTDTINSNFVLYDKETGRKLSSFALENIFPIDFEIFEKKNKIILALSAFTFLNKKIAPVLKLYEGI